MVTVLCNDSDIEVEDGVVCEICGLELEEFDQVTGTRVQSIIPTATTQAGTLTGSCWL